MTKEIEEWCLIFIEHTTRDQIRPEDSWHNVISSIPASSRLELDPACILGTVIILSCLMIDYLRDSI